MPTDVERSATATPRGPIRGPQNLVAGLTLLALAAFAIWAISNLSQGTLRAMGPAMLPRWLAIGVGLCGLALVASAFLKVGETLKFSDYAAVSVAAAILTMSALLSLLLASLAGLPFASVFYYVFLVIFYGAAAIVLLLALSNNRWVVESNLRGPVFVMAGIFAFALTIRTFGLVVAGPLAMIVGGFATSEVRWKEIIIFAAVMTAFCVGLFRYGLNLPIPIFIIPGVYHF
jgi:hypothetical protein